MRSVPCMKVVHVSLKAVPIQKDFLAVFALEGPSFSAMMVLTVHS